MRVREIFLRNYQLFRELSVPCARRMNVFVGKNGAGKSSLLNALAALLSCFPARLRSASGGGGAALSEDVIRYGEKSAELGISAVFPDVPEAVAWRVARSRRGVLKSGASSFGALNGYIRRLKGAASVSPEDGSVGYAALPALAYYRTNRSVAGIPGRAPRRAFSQLDAYDAAFSGCAGFRPFFEWFREREDWENESRRGPGFREDPGLAAVKRAMSAFLPGFEEWRVFRRPLRMTVRKQGREVVVNDLSDGEKGLMAMVGDLARRLAMANPAAENPCEGRGVVLIDEVELHLHPAWQKDVLPNLLKTFPRVQFFVTTHSPLVLSQLNACLLRAMGGARGRGGPGQSELAVWTLSGGRMESLLDGETGLIAPGEMDGVIGQIDEEFDRLLAEGAPCRAL